MGINAVPSGHRATKGAQVDQGDALGMTLALPADRKAQEDPGDDKAIHAAILVGKGQRAVLPGSEIVFRQYVKKFCQFLKKYGQFRQKINAAVSQRVNKKLLNFFLCL
jgi:hypothetical protein